ncbi:MAG: imidazoleglycerol-phosphate dehydratase [Spirochaetales bacterium]|nr:imidazoleglycerol-phosphate dehydratase [Spirochaetales bacterium]
MSRTAEISRTTKETNIKILIDLDSREEPKIDIELPFFTHILYSMAFHGGFYMEITGRGDIDVDPHHLVEDIGLVLGDVFTAIRTADGPHKRFGHFIIPMDEALSEVTIDVAGRPYLVYNANYPQPVAGTFDISLLKEFLLAFANRGGMNIHAVCRYGDNSHHMAEALFKALGKALGQAFSPAEGNIILSTKGKL